MSVLSSATAALSTYYEGESDPNNPEHVELNTIRMLAKLPVIAAYAHKKSIGQAFLYPDNSLSFVDNFLKLNFGVLSELYEINPVMSRALERLLILHEDHEQNASTSTVRLVGSTGANQFSSISAGHQRPLRPAARRRERGRPRRCWRASATPARACSASSSGSRTKKTA